jgi:hypothetical protein
MKKTPPSNQRVAALRVGMLSLSLVLSTAFAAKPSTASGVDLDISQFRATTKVDLSSSKGADIRIDLSVSNNGSLNEPRKAILTGRTVPGRGLVFQHELQVFDDPGGRPTNFTVTVIPTELGLASPPAGIRWQVFIADDDPDDDVAEDITVIRR